LIATSGSYHDEVDTLSSSDIAHRATGLTVQLYRFDSSDHRVGPQLCFGECTRTSRQLGIGQFALAPRWQRTPAWAVPN